MNCHLTCPICSGTSELLDVVDFNTSCSNTLGLSGIPVYYVLCTVCDFCFAPEIMKWTPDKFKENIYNKDYILVDPEYIDIRPRGNAAQLVSIFGDDVRTVRHLDYGGGSGILAAHLRNAGWSSVTYDPFAQKDCCHVEQLGQFDLITAFEVFEHVPNPHQLMADLHALLAPGGIILLTTEVSDGQIHKKQRLTWWYAAPRNGHISLYSKNSLAVLGHTYGFALGSLSSCFHVFYTTPPAWAAGIFRTR